MVDFSIFFMLLRLAMMFVQERIQIHFGLQTHPALVGAVLALTGSDLFVLSRFCAHTPSNNSLCNTRQRLTWGSYTLLGICGLYTLYHASFLIFRGAMAFIFLCMELLSVVFWFYDPFIYIFSRLLCRKHTIPCSSTPNKLNRFAIIGCAHNEEQVIGELVKSLYAASYPKNKYDVYVICDNCADNTADAIRKAGAIAMERHDPEHRGKGFGLRWMFDILTAQHEQGNVYDAYIILDADNLVNDEFFYAINDKLNEGHEIMQTYLGCKNPKDTWVSGSYSFCYWVSNTIYQHSHARAKLSAQMSGTGMVLRPSVLRNIGWDTDSLTEDLVLTARYVLGKRRPCGWVHGARLYDEKPLKIMPSVRQRTRWMQGYMAAMFKFAPRLVWSGIRHRSWIQIDVAFYHTLATL